MSFDTTAFRLRYRDAIHPYYNAWLHAGFVLVFGLLCIAFLWRQTTDVQFWEWLALPLGLIFQNWGEYQVHKNMGHMKRRWSTLFYQRHTGDHHSFFVPGQMTYESAADWRIILFPPWLIVVFALGVLPLWWWLSQFNANAAALFCGAMLFGYISYEILHACEHLPEQHPLTRLPWICQIRVLHALHHDRDLMHRYNFNITYPLWDWIYGTLYWPTDLLQLKSKNTITMQHHVDIARSPEQVLEYVSTPTRWQEWHHYPVTIKGPVGSLSTGAHFDYYGGRAGYLRWDVLEVIPAQRWRAQARGKYGLLMAVTYECHAIDGGTRFTRTLEYQFSNWIGRLADRLRVRKKIEQDSIAVLKKLQVVAEQMIPSSTEEGGALHKTQ